MRQSSAARDGRLAPRLEDARSRDDAHWFLFVVQDQCLRHARVGHALHGGAQVVVGKQEPVVAVFTSVAASEKSPALEGVVTRVEYDAATSGSELGPFPCVNRFLAFSPRESSKAEDSASPKDTPGCPAGSRCESTKAACVPLAGANVRVGAVIR